jgi:hypothetical protein
VAEIAAVCVVLTAATLAVNDAVLEPEAIDTVVGTETALLVLERDTSREFEGAGLTDRMQSARPAMAKELGVQVNAVRAGNSTAETGGASDTETDLIMLP